MPLSWQTPPTFTNTLVSATDMNKLTNDLNYLNHRPLYAKSNGDLALTTSFQDIPNCSVTIDQDGYWEIECVFDFLYSGSGDNGQELYGTTNVSGIGDLGEWAVFKAIDPYRITISQQWRSSLSNGTVVVARAKKQGGSGGAKIVGSLANTTLLVTLVAS